MGKPYRISRNEARKQIFFLVRKSPTRLCIKWVYVISLHSHSFHFTEAIKHLVKTVISAVPLACQIRDTSEKKCACLDWAQQLGWSQNVIFIAVPSLKYQTHPGATFQKYMWGFGFLINDRFKPLQCRSANPEDSLLETSPQRRSRCSFETRSENSKREQKCYRINPVEQQTPNSGMRLLLLWQEMREGSTWRLSVTDAQVTRTSEQGFNHSIKFLGLFWKMMDGEPKKHCFASAKWHFQRTYLKPQAQHLGFKEENGGDHRRKRWFLSTSLVFTLRPRDTSEVAVRFQGQLPTVNACRDVVPKPHTPTPPLSRVLTLKKPILTSTSSCWNQMSTHWPMTITMN